MGEGSSASRVDTRCVLSSGVVQPRVPSGRCCSKLGRPLVDSISNSVSHTDEITADLPDSGGPRRAAGTASEFRSVRYYAIPIAGTDVTQRTSSEGAEWLIRTVRICSGAALNHHQAGAGAPGCSRQAVRERDRGRSLCPGRHRCAHDGLGDETITWGRAAATRPQPHAFVRTWASSCGHAGAAAQDEGRSRPRPAVCFRMTSANERESIRSRRVRETGSGGDYAGGVVGRGKRAPSIA